MTLQAEIFERLAAKLNEVQRQGSVAEVAELTSELHRQFPEAEIRSNEIEAAIVDRAKVQMIPVKFDGRLQS